MKVRFERLKRWGRIIATACRYSGVVILTYTLASIAAVEEEFEEQVTGQLQSVAGPNWADDISTVAECTRSAVRRLSGEDIVAALSEGREEDGKFREWLEEVRMVNEYAIQLEESVIRGTTIKAMSQSTKQGYSPFDAFYGEVPNSSQVDDGNTTSGKSREDLNNEALRAWNASMKERGYAVLSLPPGVALYPYHAAVSSCLWTGSGLLALGLIPLVVTAIRSKYKASVKRNER